MKRLISLILAVALLLSLAPAVFADGEEAGGVALAFGTIREIEQDVYDTTDKVKYYAIPVVVKNTTSEEITLNALQCIFNYDESGLAPANIQADEYSFIDPITFSSKPVSEWESKDGNAANGLITVIAATTKSNYYVRVKAGQERVLFELNLARVNDVENGDYNVTFADPYLNDDGKRMQNKIGYDDTDIQISYSQSEGNLDLTDEEKITITDGKAPVLASVAVDKDEVGYASGDVITLSAKSASGNDITGLVRFSIKDYTGTGLEITGNQLTVSAENPANVGTYTVVATPDGTNCTLAEGASAPEATFTITSKKVTDPKVEITDFVKGKTYFDMHVNTTTPGLTVGCIAYEGEGIDQNNQLKGGDVFKADTTYTIVITLTANANYVIDTTQKLTYTINGGESLTADIVEGIPVNGVTTYKAVVTATTAGKDTPRVDSTPTPSSARWKMTLKDVTLSGGRVVFDGENGTVEVPGTFAWMDPTEDVGEPTVYPGSTNVYRRFYAKFVPTDTETYAVIENIPIFVDVHKISLYITSIDSWNYNAENPFQYNGESHKVQLEIPTDLKDLVTVTYEENEKTAAGNYTAKATIEEADPTHYLIEPSNSPERTLSWQIKKGTLTDYEPTYTKEVTFGAAQQFDITPDLFGLPAYDVEHFNVQDPSSTIEDDPLLTNRTILSNGGINYELRATTIEDVNNNVTSERTLTYLYDNYEAFTVKLIIKVIAKTADTQTMKFTVADAVYGAGVSPVFTSLPEGVTADMVTVSYTGSEGTYTAATIAAAPVGDYTANAKYETSDTIYTASASFKITPKGLTVSVSHDPITYGDAAPKDGYTVEFNGLVNNDEIAEDAYTVGTEYTKDSKVDNYKFTCVLDTDKIKNYTIGNVTGELVVNPKSIVAPSVTINDPTEMTYTGSPCVQGVSVKDSEAKLTVDDISVTYENNINVGTATIIYTGKNNYTGEIRKNFKITEASITDDMITNIPSVTYDTKAHTPEVTVMFNGSKLTDADYTVSYSEDCINAGTVTVTVTGKGNFTGTASKDFAIAQAYLSVENQTVTHFRTETDAKSYAVPADMFLADEKETGFTITVTDYAGDAIFKTAPAVDGTNVNYQLNGIVGTAFVEVKVEPDSSNYANASFKLTFVVNDKKNVSGSISFPDGSAVYTGSGIAYERATLNGNSFNMTYSYTPTSNGAKLDKSGLPLTVGTYTVTADYSDANSYGTAQATFTITKATPTGTPGYTKLETSGKTLADAKLTVGTIRPAGTIAWDLPLTTVLEDGKAYAWTFTPNDTHNYTILTGTLVPYVDDGMDYIPGVIGGSTGSFTFHDVSRFDYFYNAVKWAAENGIASGTGRYTFSPNAVCTRAQTVTFLWRAAGSPLPRYRVCPFTDVQPNDYYYNAVLWAVEQGITTGLNATIFGPDVTVDRGQVAAFLYRAASAAKPNTFNPFTDVKTTAYNYDAILWAYDNRITTGTSDTTFSPDAYCTRAQIVTFLWRSRQ